MRTSLLTMLVFDIMGRLLVEGHNERLINQLILITQMHEVFSKNAGLESREQGVRVTYRLPHFATGPIAPNLSPKTFVSTTVPWLLVETSVISISL